ncbi:MAG TPA: ATP-binding protein [Pirellulales bacterium]|jgi:signal transduction histidine kinase/CheY-like chemotaxis protein|nr:ATP-binding protein [Pirellulales bacterium]
MWSAVWSDLRRPTISRRDAGIIAIALALATVVRLLLDPVLGNRSAHATYLLATVVIAWWRGLWPGLLMMFFGALLANFFFVPPRFTLVNIGLDNHITSLLNLLLSLVVVLFIATLRASGRENARLYQLAQAAVLRKEDFLAMVSHELRNPLVPIRNAVFLLAQQETLRPESTEACRLIEQQMAYLVRMVDDLLDASRVTRGIIALRREKVELQEILRSAVDLCKPLVASKGQILTVSQSPAPIFLYADPIRLEQAIANLLNNAAKYTPSSGQLWLTAETAGDFVTIRVRDTGIGVAAKDRERIFEMFEQADPAVPASSEGLGIGLALVRKIVDLHGGSVVANSPGPGLGSEFVVKLPRLHVGHAAPPPPQPAKQPLSDSAGQRRILVVDDNTAAATSMAMLLKMWQHDVQVTYDAFAALEAARSFKPDVVIADIGMPQMNGLELARQLRLMPEMQASLLIAMTGFGLPADKAKAKSAGFDLHIVKPVDPAEIEAILIGTKKGRESFCETKTPDPI